MNASDVVDLIRAVIWPAVITGLAIFFRKQVRDLLKRITTIKAGAWEAHLKEKLDAATSDVRAVETTHGTDETRGKPRAEDPMRVHFKALRSLAEAAPEAAMDLAWKTVANVLASLVATSDDGGVTGTEPTVIKQVGQAGLDAQQVRALRSLRRTRNEALQTPEAVSREAAEQYVDATESMTLLLLEFKQGE